MIDIDILPIFIGYDTREYDAYQVCKSSILKHATRPVHIQPLDERALRHAGFFSRRWRVESGRKVDELDGKPFSTEFSFTRFLVPSLCQWKGWALFVDCDFLFLTDVTEIARELDPAKAVMCCKQDYRPTSETKMDGQAQQAYNRKNWSSFVLFNNGHAANQRLTPARVNGEYGSSLHGLSWLEDADIGDIDHGWNWIDGTTAVAPKAVHFTMGIPSMAGHESQPYADAWRAERWRIGL